MTVLQLHLDSFYPPTSGGEVRTWKTAEKLASLDSLWVGCPWPPDVDLPGDITPIRLQSPLLQRKAFRIYGWNALLWYRPDHFLNRAITASVVSRIESTAVEPDTIVCESLQMFWASEQLATTYDARLILTEHNAEFSALREKLASKPIPNRIVTRAVENLHQFERRAIDRADAVVFQSKADIAKFDLENVTYKLIPNGCDVATIQAGGDPTAVRRQLELPTDTPICLFVGSFDYSPNRGAARVIATKLAPALPDAAFLLVGRNPPPVQQPNVFCPGFVQDLPGVLSLADIALCPLQHGSGTKLKMMDYLAAGLPIVTTDVGAAGIPLEDGETALLRDDVDGIRRAIERLLAEPHLRRQLSTNAAALGTQYDWDRLLEGYETLLDRADRHDSNSTPRH